MPEESNPVKEWAVFAYFAGNVPETKMHAAAIRHLLEMARIGTTDDVYMAAQIYLPGIIPRRYILPVAPAPDHLIKVIPDPSQPNANSADPRSISDFVEWGAKHCPAKNTILILSGHGYGIDDYVPPRAHFYEPRRGVSALRMVTPAAKIKDRSSELRKVPDLSAIADIFSGFIYDWPHGSVIPNASVGGAVRAATQALHQKSKLAILGFDSCEMAMAEVWGEMFDCAVFGVASQAPIPYQGWPYSLFLKRLVQDPQKNPDVIATMMVNSFIESYSGDNKAYVTLSAVKMDSIQDLMKAIKPLVTALIAEVHNAESRTAIFRARNFCPIFDPDGFIDLGCFCQFLKIGRVSPKVVSACDAVLQSLQTLIIRSGYLPQSPPRKISQSTGLSVWFPPWIQNPSVKYLEKSRSVAYLANGYADTQFAKNTGWDQFLRAMQNAAKAGWLFNLRSGDV